MIPDSYCALARYNRWMNEKIYAVASTLDDEERKRDRGAFFKSIHRTLNHLLVADRIWLGRLEGVVLEGDVLGPGGIRSIGQELYADFDELRRERSMTDAAIESWVGQITAERLAAPFRFIRRGIPFEVPLWWLASQLFNHQTHHRGQVTTLLMQAGRDPGVTDLFAMLGEEGVPSAGGVR
jgi:uncharacterized damage-inducible protein DinB